MLASFVLAFLGATLSCSALPDVVNDAMVHLGAGDWALTSLKFTMHHNHTNRVKMLTKYMTSVKRFRKEVEDGQRKLLNLKPEEASSLERLRNLIIEQNYLLMDEMDGVLKGAKDTFDGGLDQFLKEV